MTKQEQIKSIKKIIDERVETTLGQVQGRHGNVIKTVDTVIIARDIIEAGYGDVSEYEIEIKMLGSQIKVLKQRLINKYIEIDNLNRDYNNAFERLKAQQREIERLKAEFKELETNAEILARGVRDLNHENYELTEKIKQVQIDVLNKVKTLIFQKDNPYNVPFEEFISANVFCGYIDELIKEIENDK